MYKTICVYSSSSDAIAQEFFAVAEELGAALAGAGYGLIYGGARVGLMGAVARAVHAHGGHVVGVLPGVLQRKELTYEPADELIITQDLRERKAIMETRADAFIAISTSVGCCVCACWTSGNTARRRPAPRGGCAATAR